MTRGHLVPMGARVQPAKPESSRRKAEQKVASAVELASILDHWARFMNHRASSADRFRIPIQAQAHVIATQAQLEMKGGHATSAWPASSRPAQATPRAATAHQGSSLQ